MSEYRIHPRLWKPLFKPARLVYDVKYIYEESDINGYSFTASKVIAKGLTEVEAIATVAKFRKYMEDQ